MSEFIYEHVPSGDDATGNPVDAPTLVQREEIVRCRDCRWFLKDSVYGDACRWFARYNGDCNGFCKWGERRAGE